MTRDEIWNRWEQCMFATPSALTVEDAIVHFARQIAADEREACAQAAEEPYEFTSAEASRIAAAIRARGKP